MIENYDYIRKIIGTLIKHYRKQKLLSIKDFIYDNNEYLNENCITCKKCATPERICSKNTLYRLEEGKLIQNECVYHRLAHKLGKNVILNRLDIYNKLVSYRKLLIDCLINFSKTKISKLEAQITYDLNVYDNTLYVTEILSLYKSIIQDKLYSTITNKDDILTLIELKDVLSKEDKKLIIYYFYTGSFRRGNFGINLDMIIEESKDFISEPLFYSIKLDFINQQNHLIALNELINKELPKINNLAPYHKYCLYYALEYPLLNSGAFNEAYNVLTKCLEIIEASDFGEITLKNCYIRLGFVSYCLENYENAEKWLLKAFDVNHSIAKDLVILCSSLEKMEKTETIKNILKMTDTSKMKAIYGKKVFIYYMMKYAKKMLTKNDIENLEDFICNEIKPYLKVYGAIHEQIFKNDLYEFVKTTCNYKKYFTFCEQ